mgnify:CR=1 FL=1
MSIENLTSNKIFNGWHEQYTHESAVLSCIMRFAIYLPPQASNSNKVPVVYWLSGLTCTDENFMQKAGALRIAAELGIAIVTPDTSPRGDNVPDDVEGAWDFGLSAGFYVNATEKPWDEHYQMYDYILEELPIIIERNFPVSDQKAISGHSMGGHGALVLALRNPTKYSSVSAFSPISNPVNCPWGKKAFMNYLGNESKLWQQYDASLLISNNTYQHIPALVDQGLSDDFLRVQLDPESLVKAAKISDFPLIHRMHEGYDHSYYFISSFIEDHMRFHHENFAIHAACKVE